MTPDFVARRVPPATTKRTKKIPDGQLPMYMDTVLMNMGQALDAWRFSSGPADAVAEAIDALTALWVEIETRGLA